MSDKIDYEKELGRAYRALRGIYGRIAQGNALTPEMLAYHSLTLAAAMRFVGDGEMDGTDYSLARARKSYSATFGATAANPSNSSKSSGRISPIDRARPPRTPLQMNEESIPEDVMKAAQTEAGRWFNSLGKAQYHFVEAIARAIMAERQRCIRATVAISNEGGETATCLSIAEELRCPDIATKRAKAP